MIGYTRKSIARLEAVSRASMSRLRFSFLSGETRTRPGKALMTTNWTCPRVRIGRRRATSTSSTPTFFIWSTITLSQVLDTFTSQLVCSTGRVHMSEIHVPCPWPSDPEPRNPEDCETVAGRPLLQQVQQVQGPSSLDRDYECLYLGT